jgi:UDP-2,3-diacylglucosamine hydrolase
VKAIFLSDVHLRSTADPAHQRLIRFFDLLRGRGATDDQKVSDELLTVDHLVIAGDFFDFWFSRGDCVYPDFRPLIARFDALKSQGVRVSLCEGNHDFFLEDYFSRRLGFAVYPEWVELNIDGLRILVSHGDTVDRGNRKYLALRGFLRSSSARGLQRILPLGLLWRAARLSSEMSKEMSGESADRLAEIMHRFALVKFREGYDAVILGHCHKPLLRQEMIDGRQKTFATLGDWITHDSYLRYDDGRFSLMRFPPAG